MNLKCFRFVLPPVEGEFYSFEDGSATNAAILIVVDETAEAALARGKAWIIERKRSPAWLDHPSVVVTVFEIGSPTFITLAEF